MDVSEMLSELNDHGFTDTGTSRKVSMLQQAIWDIEGRELWPFLEAPVVELTYSGSSGVATNMPSNFRSAVWLKDKDGQSLTWLRYEDFENTVGDDYAEVGVPQYFYFEGNTLKVWKVPSSTEVLRLAYIRWSDEISDATLEASILLPKQYHHLIVWGALWRLYDMEDDPELASRYQSHFENGLALMRSALHQRQIATPERIQILDSDYSGGC